ncbi:MAG: YheT family hydrolase [Saprospiraceae bacterium]
MPLLPSEYKPPRAFRQADVNTIYAGVFRKYPKVDWQRERLELSDGDFVDLDWVKQAQGSKKLAVLTHGLEGHARRPYMAGMARAYHRAGYSVCVMNFRGCSGEPNRKLRSYHIGETGDLLDTIHHAIAKTNAEHVMLSGFSLGGNVVLKLLAENPDKVPKEVLGAAVFSVPLFVAECNELLNQVRNWAYRWSFIKGLNKKAKQKSQEHTSAGSFKKARKFAEFDEWYTAPWHGFDSAQHYWEANSSGPILHQLKHPVLVVNAKDDTFLHDCCYPVDLAQKLEHFNLEVPGHGGHCGFVERNRNGDYYSDRRAVAFAETLTKALV